MNISVNLKLQFHVPIIPCTLRIGGISPFPFLSDQVLLIDRCVVGIIKKILNNSTREDIKYKKEWLNFINFSSLSINPFMYAFEGCNRKNPSFEEFCDQFDEAQKILKYFFPKANIVKFTDVQYSVSYKIIEEIADKYNSEIDFLLSICDLILHPKSNKELPECQEKIFIAAKNSGIKNPSLVLLAAISCIYSQKSAAREIIKPKVNFNKLMAHNAISDFRSLEILMAANSLLDIRSSYVTIDEALAKFWLLIKVSNPRYDDEKNTMRYDLKFENDLFPRLKDTERLNLRNKILNF